MTTMLARWMTILLSTIAPNNHNRNNKSTSSHLRIIQINDVYSLDCFPHLKTLINAKRIGNDDDNSDDNEQQQDPCEKKTIVVCAGDFLSPSLLSSLDKGAAMVDTLNQVGVTHVCFGNHENDVGMAALVERIQQSDFLWINTNMPQLVNKIGLMEKTHKVPEYDIIHVGTRRKVALLGLLTDDPSLYRPDAFGGATIEPVAQATEDCCRRHHLHLLDDNHNAVVDLVVPLTHQSMAQDREFCQHFGGGKFPIICGGHDHEMYDETVAGNRILKTGMDATHAVVIDIIWDDDHACDAIHKPTDIQVEMVATKDFPPDEDLVQRIRGHRKVLERLTQAQLFRIADWMDDYGDESFSTRNNRLGPSTGTSALATMLRMAMRVPCAILNAGSVRANKVYDQQEFFTWSDLKAEMPFSSEMTVVEMPGKVLEETIAASRASTSQTKDASGAYLHCCNNIVFNDETKHIESIRGKPFDPNISYLTALPALLLSGLDDHKPLLQWVANNNIQPEKYEEKAIPAKMLIVEVFSALIWLQLGSFDDIDRNKDGKLCRDEVKARVTELYGHDAVADLVVNSIFSVADMNNDNTIIPLEMMIVQFCATDLIDHVCTPEELATMKLVASKVLGLEPSHDEVKRMVTMIRDTVDSLDDNIDGLINRNEVMNAIGDFDAAEMDLLK